MTDEEKQAKKDFVKLQKAATKLGVEFTDETTAAELTVLVDEAQAKVDAEKQASKTEFHIYNGEEFVRTYSVEVHGPDAEELAKEYVSHNPGEIR